MATVGKIPDRKDVELIGRVYDGAGKKLTKIFMSVYPIVDFEVSGIQGLMKQVRSIVNTLDRFALTWTNSSVNRAYSEARAVSETKLRALKKKPDPDYDKSIHKITVDSVVNATEEDLIKANQSIIVSSNIYFNIISKAKEGLLELQAWDMRDEEVIASLLDDAIRKGSSRGKIANLILEHFRRLMGDEQYIRINSRNYNIKSYSKMVARTRLRHVQSQATRNSCAQYGHDIVEISNHGTETELCQEFEGNIYSLTGSTPGYDVLPEEPPFHPNCQHNMFPTSEEAIQARSEFPVSEEFL